MGETITSSHRTKTGAVPSLLSHSRFAIPPVVAYRAVSVLCTCCGSRFIGNKFKANTQRSRTTQDMHAKPVWAEKQRPLSRSTNHKSVYAGDGGKKAFNVPEARSADRAELRILCSYTVPLVESLVPFTSEICLSEPSKSNPEHLSFSERSIQRLCSRREQLKLRRRAVNRVL